MLYAADSFELPNDPVIVDQINHQEELKGIFGRMDLPLLADRDAIRVWSRRFDALVRDGHKRQAGLVALALGRALRKTDISLALHYLSQSQIQTNTALGEIAIETTMEILETNPEWLSTVGPFILQQLPTYPHRYNERFFQICLAANDEKTARAVYKLESADRQPKDPWSLWAQARLAILTDHKQEAVKPLEDILCNAAGSIYWAMALQALKPLAKKDPLTSVLTADDLLQTAVTSFGKGQINSARLCFQTYQKVKGALHGHDPHLLESATASYQSGQYREAITQLNRYLPRGRSGRVEKHQLLAAAYRKINNRKRFLYYIRQLEKEHVHSAAYLDLLRAEAFDAEVDGRSKTIRTEYRKILRYFPKSPVAAEASWKLAWQAWVSGDYKQADKYFRQSMDADDGTEYALAGLFWHGRCQEQMSNTDEARRVYDAIRDVFPYSYYALAGQLSDLPPAEASDAGNLTSWSEWLRQKYFDEAKAGERDWFNELNPADRFYTLEATAAGCYGAAYRRLSNSSLRERPASFYLSLSWLAARAGDTFHFISSYNRAAPELFTYTLVDIPLHIRHHLFPDRYISTIRSLVADSNLDPLLVLSLIRQESGFQSDAVSGSDAIGLMQLLPATAAGKGKKAVGRLAVRRRLFDPEYNLRKGCHHLTSLLRSLDGNVPLALAAYNGGLRRIRDLYRRYAKRLSMMEIIEMIPMSQSRNYVKSILRNYNYYRLIYYGKPVDLRACLGEEKTGN